MHTDLQYVKKITTFFLHQEPEITNPNMPLFIVHPVLETRVAYLTSENRMFDIFDEPDTYKKWLEEIEDTINSATTLSRLVRFIRKPYLLGYFKYVCDALSEEDFAETLGDIWCDTETPSDETNASHKDKVLWFKKANKKHLMTEEEYNTFLMLPDKLMLYRGCRMQEKKHGMSWTLNKDKAEWFARRYEILEASPVIYIVEINKNQVLAYFNRRDEDEIVIDSHRLNKEEIKEVRL